MKHKSGVRENKAIHEYMENRPKPHDTIEEMQYQGQRIKRKTPILVGILSKILNSDSR